MWLDDVIAIVAPEKALRNERARNARKFAKRAYEGATSSRRNEGWVATGSSANAEVNYGAKMLRDRARDLVRNNPYARKAVKVHITNMIGFGIAPSVDTQDEVENLRIMDAWNSFVDNCDADGQHDFYGLQALIERARYESGECFVRLRYRRPSDNFMIPLQLQVLESDFLDTTKNGKHGTNEIRQGIEIDALGRRIAYWMFTQHPGDTYSVFNGTSYVSVRIPAEEILHIYNQERPGQLRGVSEFAPVIVKMRDFDEYDEAELVRKKIESCFAAFVTSSSDADGPPLGVTKETNSKQQRVEAFEPAMVTYLKEGEDVKFGEPSSGGNYNDYARSQLYAISTGLGITYEQLTGDLSNVNYSSMRAGLLEFRRQIDQARWNMFIPQVCAPVWREVMRLAFIAGLVKRPAYAAKWTPPKWDQVDPVKDATADLLRMRSGTLLLEDAIAANGNDPDEHIKRLQAMNKKLDDGGIILDSDPRKVSKNGTPNIPLDPTENPANA